MQSFLIRRFFRELLRTLSRQKVDQLDLAQFPLPALFNFFSCYAGGLVSLFGNRCAAQGTVQQIVVAPSFVQLTLVDIKFHEESGPHNKIVTDQSSGTIRLCAEGLRRVTVDRLTRTLHTKLPSQGRSSIELWLEQPKQ